MIQAGHHAGLIPARIARQIGRHRATVCRELARNQGPDGTYYASIAHVKAANRRRRPKSFKLRSNPRLCRQIELYMDQGWSPGLIAQVLAIEGVSDGLCRNRDRMLRQMPREGADHDHDRAVLIGAVVAGR